ncbi:MAG: ThuA domain-containing protein [Planctomycetota bacterium]|nr:MAG: ThuA domain-containing protein [Planctomycetota bacterium]
MSTRHNPLHRLPTERLRFVRLPSRGLVLGAIAAVIWFAVGTHAVMAAEPIRVLLTVGGHGFQEKEFFAMWDSLPGIRYEKAVLPEEADRLAPGLETKFDVIARYDMVPAFSPKQRENFVALLERGIGLVALHHNLGAHRNWPEYRKIIGGAYLFEPLKIDDQTYGPSTYSHGEDLHVTIAATNHPITQGLKAFTIHDEAYKNYYLAESVQLLLKTDTAVNDPSIAWTTHYGNSRVVYLQLGHDSLAWRHPMYPELLVRSIRWAAEGTK